MLRRQGRPLTPARQWRWTQMQWPGLTIRDHVDRVIMLLYVHNFICIWFWKTGLFLTNRMPLRLSVRAQLNILAIAHRPRGRLPDGWSDAGNKIGEVIWPRGRTPASQSRSCRRRAASPSHTFPSFIGDAAHLLSSVAQHHNWYAMIHLACLP